MNNVPHNYDKYIDRKEKWRKQRYKVAKLIFRNLKPKL